MPPERSISWLWFASQHEIADLVGRVPDQRISQRIAEKGSEHRGDDAAADDPGDKHGHDEMGADEGRERREHAGGEAERDGMRRGAQAPQAIDDM